MSRARQFGEPQIHIDIWMLQPGSKAQDTDDSRNHAEERFSSVRLRFLNIVTARCRTLRPKQMEHGMGHEYHHIGINSLD